MEAACFTAWQVLRGNGYKKNWNHYRKAMGFGKDSDKVTKEGRDTAIGAALDIDKKFGNGAANGRA